MYWFHRGNVPEFVVPTEKKYRKVIEVPVPGSTGTARFSITSGPFC